MTTYEDLQRRIDELRQVANAQSDLIAHLISQSVLSTARLEVCISLLGDLLEKHGIDKTATREKCQTLLAQFVSVAQSEAARALHAANATRLPSTAGPDTQKN